MLTTQFFFLKVYIFQTIFFSKNQQEKLQYLLTSDESTFSKTQRLLGLKCTSIKSLNFTFFLSFLFCFVFLLACMICFIRFLRLTQSLKRNSLSKEGYTRLRISNEDIKKKDNSKFNNSILLQLNIFGRYLAKISSFLCPPLSTLPLF